MKKITLRLPFSLDLRAKLTTPLRLLLATTAAFWMGTVQAQVPGGALRSATELRFRDFFSAPIGAAGLQMSDTLRQADGQVVRLVGYMVEQETPVPGRFMLTPRPVAMSEHADGDADDLPPATVVVYLEQSQSEWLVPHVRGLISVVGVLHVGRFEERDGRVSWVRLQLDNEAARGMSALEFAAYLHALQHWR